MLSWAAVTARADNGATRARLWEHGSGACVQVIDDVGNADDLVYEFATYCIATPGRPTQHLVEVCIETSDSFLTSMRLEFRDLRQGGEPRRLHDAAAFVVTYHPQSNSELPMILEQGPLDQKTCRFDRSATTCQCKWSWFECDADSRSCFDGASAIKTAPMITRTATPISSPRATMLRHAWVPMSAA